MNGDSRRLLLGTEALSGERDWAQLCLFTGGRAIEVDLSPAQLSAVSLAIGLVTSGEDVETMVDDELMTSAVLPSMLESLPAIWAQGTERR